MKRLIVFIGIVLSFGLCVFAFPGVALADEGESNVIEISTVEGLNNIRNNLNGNYVLMCNIDLSDATSSGGEFFNDGKGWEPIGTEDEWFEGTLDGQGFTISGLNSKGYENTALFATNKGTITNLKIDKGTCIGLNVDYGCVAGLVAFNRGQIENCSSNCTVSATVSQTKAYYCGGVVAFNGEDGQVIDCVNMGAITGKATNSVNNADTLYCGGVSGYSCDYVKGINKGKIVCEVTSGKQIAVAGGVVGFNAGTTIDSSQNSGEVSVLSKANTAYAGGIVGFTSADIIGCKNTGHVIGKAYKTDSIVGGIVGCSTSNLNGCSNSGSINAERYQGDYEINCGGIAGKAGTWQTEVQLTNCGNSGTITAKNGAEDANVGGITGKLEGSDALIEQCSNSGKITGSCFGGKGGYCLGGISGYCEFSVIYTSYNTGTIQPSYTKNSEEVGIVSGGITAELDGGCITQCYNKGTIKGTACYGGICAYNDGGIVTNSYNTGTIESGSLDPIWDDGEDFGGIVGVMLSGGKVGLVYNVGLIKEGFEHCRNHNGVIGVVDQSTCKNTVYNLNWQGYATNNHKIGHRCSLSQMKKKGTFSGFNFSSIWKMGTGTYKLPILRNCVNASKQNSNTINISKATVKLSAKSKTYTGKARKVTPTVSGLKSGTDYAVSYSNNTNVGTAKVIVKGKGAYSGSKSVSFKINPKGTTLKKLSKGKKSIKVVWNKQTKQTTGYQIQYGLKKNFSGAKTLTIKSNKTNKTTIKKLKAKKRYYVRVRTYKTVKGKKYYSTWSKVKDIKTK